MTEVERVIKLIDTLTSKKEKDAAEVSAKINELQADENAARQDMDAAIAALDEAAYNSAEFKLKAMESRRAMYEGKLEQIAKSEFISEEESEATIDALLAYEDDLGTQFEKAITPHISALEKLLKDYRHEVDKTELTIQRWTNTIRQTYYNRTGAFREVDGEVTRRFDHPQTVHPFAYVGCKAAGALGALLESVKKSMR